MTPLHNLDFLDFVALIHKHRVDALVVDAHAVSFHGHPRGTGDLDIWVRPNAENARRVWRVLLDFGAPVDAHEVRAEDFAVEGTVYQIGLPPCRIDVLTRITGAGFDEAWAGAVDGEFGTVPTRYIGRNELLRNKQAAGRPKDLADLHELLRH